MKRIVAASAALLLAVPAPGLAAPAIQPPAAAKPVAAKAMELSLVLNPTEAMLDLSMRAFDAGFANGAKNDATAAALFAENPGLMDVMLAAAHPVVRKHMLLGIPAMQKRFAEFYGKSFSDVEMDALLGFYRSPTGKKLIAGMYAGADLASLVEAAGADGEGAFTPENVRGFTHSTTKRILPAFNDDDKKMFVEFMGQPAFAKLNKILPEFRQLMAEVANEPSSPEMDADLSRAVDRAVEEYFASRSTRDLG